MSAPQQVVAAGSAVTGAGVVAGFLAKAIPVLQFVSLSVGIIVGVMTAVYTWRRLREPGSGR